MELVFQELENSLSNLATVTVLELSLKCGTLEPRELDLGGCVFFAHGLEVRLHVRTIIKA